MKRDMMGHTVNPVIRGDYHHILVGGEARSIIHLDSIRSKLEIATIKPHQHGLQLTVRAVGRWCVYVQIQAVLGLSSWWWRVVIDPLSKSPGSRWT